MCIHTVTCECCFKRSHLSQHESHAIMRAAVQIPGCVHRNSCTAESRQQLLAVFPGGSFPTVEPSEAARLAGSLTAPCFGMMGINPHAGHPGSPCRTLSTACLDRLVMQRLDLHRVPARPRHAAAPRTADPCSVSPGSPHWRCPLREGRLPTQHPARMLAH